MKLAITGCNGRVGRRVVALALKHGHTVVGIDCTPLTQSAGSPDRDDRFTFLELDLRVYEDALKALDGCEAVCHLAAFPNPGDYTVDVHNSNVVISWNILRGCAELGITRIAQASSVNVLALVYSQGPRFEYFPIDEQHPCLPDEPYGLSKLICEMQADTIVRRYPSMRIASMRLHWSIPDREVTRSLSPEKSSMDLWGYVQEDSSAEAFLLAIEQDDLPWSGHEAFFIVAPEIAYAGDSKELRERYWPDVPVREGKDVSGKLGFFDCSKAEKLLGWQHKDST